MLSIIVCSVSPEYLQALDQNISETIETEYELIPVDNRTLHWPIAKVYNAAAAKAKYPYLFFVHEDVKFHSIGWGKIIEEKLIEPDCGIIGFAGSKVRLNCYSPLGQSFDWMVMHLCQRVNEKTRFDVCNVFLEKPFDEVVTVDGFGLFVRTDVWRKHPFDEIMLKGFHCYDIDFSLQLFNHGYVNYVCTSGKVVIEHFSLGYYNSEWFLETLRLHKGKWSKILPIMVPNIKMSKHKIKKYEESISFDFVKLVLRSNYRNKRLFLCEFLKRPFSWKHFVNCILLLAKLRQYTKEK